MLSHARVRVRAAAAGDSSALARHRLGKGAICRPFCSPAAGAICRPFCSPAGQETRAPGAASEQLGGDPAAGRDERGGAARTACRGPCRLRGLQRGTARCVPQPGHRTGFGTWPRESNGDLRSVLETPLAPVNVRERSSLCACLCSLFSACTDSLPARECHLLCGPATPARWE